MEVGGALPVRHVVLRIEIAHHIHVRHSSKTFTQRHGSKRVGAQRGVRRINIARFKSQPEQLEQAKYESRDAGHQEKICRDSFHDASALGRPGDASPRSRSTFRANWSTISALISYMPYQVRSKTERFSPNAISSPGRA